MLNFASNLFHKTNKILYVIFIEIYSDSTIVIIMMKMLLKRSFKLKAYCLSFF